MREPLSDDDVERIASRVVTKTLEGIVKIALVVVLGIWLLPIVFFGGLSALVFMTRDLPTPLPVIVMTAALAVPVIALVLVWSRRRRA